MANRKKACELVHEAIRNLRLERGFTPKEISRYIETNHDVKPLVLSRGVAAALRHGVDYGIFEKPTGYDARFRLARSARNVDSDDEDVEERGCKKRRKCTKMWKPKRGCSKRHRSRSRRRRSLCKRRKARRSRSHRRCRKSRSRSRRRARRSKSRCKKRRVARRCVKKRRVVKKRCVKKRRVVKKRCVKKRRVVKKRHVSKKRCGRSRSRRRH